jgi:DNA-binding NarL/FixJ family response regulator
MIAFNVDFTEVTAATSRHPSLHVIGGDRTSRGYLLNQLARIGFAAEEAETPASLLVRESDEELRRRRAYWSGIEDCFAKLADRERDVLDLLMQRLPNKVLALRLGITERAVEMRRAGLMKKLEVGSLTELIQLATRFSIVQQYGILLPIN